MPLSSLNTEQLSAATASLGHNLIIASAGTGKTSTIVGRIAHLLQTGVEPSSILLLTFTNKAAGEMIARLERYFPKKVVSQIESGTFHAVSFRWLKTLYPNLTLKQPSELKTLFRSIYEKRNFVRMNLTMQPFSATYLYDMYSLYQNASLESFDVWFLEKYPEHEQVMDIYMDITQEFEKEKIEFGFASFNDLLLRMKSHLETQTIPFTEVLVDEYQDTNTLQSALIDVLKPKSLFCVGDYDQSIYAFNGANIENIATYSKRYDDASVFTLKTNYRSTAPILSLANRVIERNERIYPKKLEVGRHGKTHPPKLLMYNDLFEQYQSIAQSIKHTHVPNDQIAVIFRNNSSADGVEASLREYGIPCKRKGGTSFFDAKEIKFLLDLLSLLVNPKDMMAFIHIFEYARGVGSALSKELFQCFLYFGEGNLLQGVLYPKKYDLPKLNPNKNVQLGLFDDDQEIGSSARFNSLHLNPSLMKHPLLKHPKMTIDAVTFFRDYYELVKELHGQNNPSSILKIAIHSKLYANIIALLSTQRGRLKSGEIDEEKKSQAKERIERKANLLLDLSRQYRELRRFVNAMVLGGNELSEGEGVNLLTVHASKGLEFPEVYVIDLVDGRFPNRKMMSSVEEERRLFYVAVTRAKDKLYLSLAKFDKVKKIDYKPSQFLHEAGLIKGEFIEPEVKEK
ncbi:MAG: ATP-dependent DNA helicase UvrD/PcrA/Rep, epsilon proteobacterial type 1 [uncultured Sulfurovum sp.]|uniref:DNA 3'-5' helicase n=1 Tax=uncultured Sulfurovum sp. TaxID=269237 RepID=A0A6S6S640_9BACT|nr:MAG: ATP-dependent DNA helicase UvrD/PcrA/Rep, epsilon proteobacterial type 1 [uncultured Sulfurovum sp.]